MNAHEKRWKRGGTMEAIFGIGRRIPKMNSKPIPTFGMLETKDLCGKTRCGSKREEQVF